MLGVRGFHFKRFDLGGFSRGQLLYIREAAFSQPVPFSSGKYHPGILAQALERGKVKVVPVGMRDENCVDFLSKVEGIS
jgi:hypothetical protein